MPTDTPKGESSRRAAPLAWARPERPGRDPSLTRERIVRAALEIADEEGPEGISMRRIAAKLGVGTMSLYYHVASKEDLLDLMLEAIYGEVGLPVEPSGDWRADLTVLATRMRETLRRHMRLVMLAGGRPPLGPNALRQIEYMLATLHDAGLDTPTVQAVIAALENYILGYVLHEGGEEEARRRTGLDEEQWRNTIAPHVMEIVTKGNYPHFARYVMEDVEYNTDERFAVGLDCLLDGIAVRIVAAK